MEVRSVEELVEYASDVLANRRPYEPVTIATDTLTFQATIRGEGWDKRVDARLAKYVLSLQEAMDDLLADHGIDAYNETPPRVRVEVKEGSSNPWADVADFAKALITPMTPEQRFIAVVIAIAASAGYFYLARWLKHREQLSADKKGVEELSLHEKTKLETLRVLQAVAENNPEKFVGYERPPRTLVNMMDEDDEIAFEGSEPIAKTEARKVAPKRLPRSEEKTSYADGDYFLKAINYTEGEPVLIISQNGQDVKAYISALDEADSKELLDNIGERQLTEELPLAISVQVNVRHTARRIKYASIVGVGAPRTDRDHLALSDIALSLQ